MYIAAKGYVCCTAMNDFSNLWTGLTFTCESHGKEFAKHITDHVPAHTCDPSAEK